MSFAELLDVLAYQDGEHLSINYNDNGNGGKFTSTVVRYGERVEAVALERCAGTDGWFGVNPVRPRSDGKRGGLEDVTRLAAIWCDLDVKGAACRDLDHAHQIIGELSSILGTRPVAIVQSGSGLHPYWAIEDGQIDMLSDDPAVSAVVEALRADCAALLKRWGRLACIVADGMGAKIDRGVYDLPRVLRIPGTDNYKTTPPGPVTVEFDTGAPISLEELRERLDEHGVAEYDGDRGERNGTVVSKPDAWSFAPGVCEYFAPTIRAWQTEPVTERHPWLTRQAVRIMAALRNGCLSADTFAEAKRVVIDRFTAECARDGRPVGQYEVQNAFTWAEGEVSLKSDAELATEFGSHLHLWQRAEPRRIELAPPAPAATRNDTPLPAAPAVSGGGPALAPVVNIASAPSIAAPQATLTDTGNADLLVHAWAGRMRYCPDTGKWYVWRETRWEAGTDGGEAMTAARNVIESIRADEDSSPDLVKHKIRSLSRKSLENMVALAKCSPDMRVRLADLDAHAYELNTPAGIVDLRSGVLTRHDPSRWHTKIAGAGFDPTAPAPRWEKFLHGTFDGDPELIAYVQRLAGLAAIGNVTHHVLPFWFGSGGNGKSVLADVLTAVLGDYAITAPANFLLAGRERHETEIARLHGARMVICSEVNADSKFDEAKVKVLTGGDVLSGRFMRQDFFDFVPSHTLILMGNHQPQVSAGGQSFWRRLRLVPFLHTVPPQDRNPNIASELVESEGAAILAWIVAGARAVAEGGLNDPKSVMDATAEYGEQEDALGRFVEECCVLDPEASAQPTIVQAAFQFWAGMNGESQDMSVIKLGRELSSRFGVRAERSSATRFYRGLRVLDQWIPPSMRAR